MFVKLTSAPSDEGNVLYQYPMLDGIEIEIENMDRGPYAPMNKHGGPQLLICGSMGLVY
jgi:hypothetical protein